MSQIPADPLTCVKYLFKKHDCVEGLTLDIFWFGSFGFYGFITHMHTHTVLGYSTKVHFNACCKPSPLFDSQKVLTSLPISIGPGYLVDTMRTVLQFLLDLCQDPVAALERIPTGPSPNLVARTLDGETASHGFPPPAKLSEYWIKVYEYSSLLECCENFLSAVPPSAPCLICHPFGKWSHCPQC